MFYNRINIYQILGWPVSPNISLEIDGDFSKLIIVNGGPGEYSIDCELAPPRTADILNFDI